MNATEMAKKAEIYIKALERLTVKAQHLKTLSDLQASNEARINLW